MFQKNNNKQKQKRNYGIYIFKKKCSIQELRVFLDLKPRWRERRRFLLWQPALVALTTTPTYLKAGGPAPGAPRQKDGEALDHIVEGPPPVLIDGISLGCMCRERERDESPLYGPVLCDSILFSFLFISYIQHHYIALSLCLSSLVLCIYNGERYWISNGVSRFLFSSSTDVCLLRVAATE